MYYIYIGLGPLVARGNPCCAVPVPFYVDNALADLEPSKGAAADPAWHWPGYKALDIAAGAHFSLAVVMNISGPGCTEDGLQTGVACVRQNVRNGLTEQVLHLPCVCVCVCIYIYIYIYYILYIY